MRPTANHILLTRQLLPYFKMFPLDRMTWPGSNLQTMDKELKKWRSLPQSYLSIQELISLCQHWCLEAYAPKSKLELIEYIEKALQEIEGSRKPELHFIMGLTHLELAISLPKRKQQSHLRLAQMSFGRAQKNCHLELSSQLHNVIVLVARDQLLQAVKLLHQLSRSEFIEGQAVIFSIWKTLEKIYIALGRSHWAQFYRQKWEKQRMPIMHDFSGLKAA
jgi:hypothetical protein